MTHITDEHRRAFEALKAVEKPVPVPLPLPAKYASGPKVADLAKCYLEYHDAVRCKPKTQRTARSIVNRRIVPVLGKLPTAAVERNHVMALQESLCETPAMANMVVETLTYMFKLAKGWDMVPEDHDDPCQSIPMNPKRKRDRFLTDAELTGLGQVLDEVSDKASQVSDGAVTTIRLLMLAGCRKTEIMTLRWNYVDLGRTEMRVVNGKYGDRTVHLSPSAVSMFAALPREPGNPWVVPGAKPSTHMADIDGAWQTIRVKAGLHDVRIHDIPHPFASRAHALGEGLPIIGRLLGHRRVETTTRYAYLARDRSRRLVQLHRRPSSTHQFGWSLPELSLDAPRLGRSSVGQATYRDAVLPWSVLRHRFDIRGVFTSRVKAGTTN